jgi:hypothetical protein
MADVNLKIPGNLVGVWISTNLVTADWKEVVCGQDASLDGSKDVTTTVTKCGVIKTTSDPSWSFSGSGILNYTPGAAELSSDELITILQGDTDVLVKLAYATDDTLYYREGQGVMTAYGEASTPGDPVSFTYTIEVSGDLTLVPTT